MDLAPGTRVGLGADDGPNCVAVIEDVSAAAIVVELLDDLDYELVRDGAVTIFVPREEGLHYWRASAPDPPEGGRLSLSLVGPAQVLQRRQYQRYAVDLTAQIRRVRRGRRTPPAVVQVIDLSSGGAKVVGSTVATTGDTVIFDLDVGGGTLTTTARVAMTYPDGEGRRVAHLAFSMLQEPTAGLLGIDRYLSSLGEAATASTRSG